MEWICNPPVFSIPDEFTNETVLEIKKSTSKSVAMHSLRLFCMKSSIVSYEWSIYDVSMTQVSHTVTPALILDQSELFLPIRMSLDYGRYTLRLRVNMVIDETVFGPTEPVFSDVEGRFEYGRSKVIPLFHEYGIRFSYI